MTSMTRRTMRIVALGTLACSGTAFGQFSSGPDVVYSECFDVGETGSVGTMHGYSLSSDTCNIGDKVSVTATRPLSKTKRWRLVEVMERAK